MPIEIEECIGPSSSLSSHELRARSEVYVTGAFQRCYGGALYFGVVALPVRA